MVFLSFCNKISRRNQAKKCEDSENSKAGGRFLGLHCCHGRKGPFSQWHPSQFTVNGVTYSRAEQFMMHQKALLFGDATTAAKILATDDPCVQKKLGRRAGPFRQDLWDRECRRIVREGNLAKFSQNPALKAALFATAGTTLVEASPVDCIWGVGLAASDPAILDRATWRGENRLGEILTQVREELQAQEAA
jgi:ribA/ribD-fused uncharacterized protein